MEAAREPKARRGPTAKVESPPEAKQTEEFFDPEKEWSELHEDMEGEDDPWAGMGTDDEEETLPNEQHAGEDAADSGKTNKDDNCMSVFGSPLQKRTPHSGRDGACLPGAVSSRILEQGCGLQTIYCRSLKSSFRE